jgi:hypothetical protein
MFKGPVHCAPFKEHPIVDVLVKEPEDFDIFSVLPEHNSSFLEEGKFSLQQYCYCLLHKIVILNKSKIKPFIYYQCESLTDPFTWLNKLEKIIDLNRDLFTTKDHKIKIEKTLIVIEVLRSDIENNKFNKTSKFDFEKVKSKLKNYQTPEEQLSFLYEAQAEYLQNKPRAIDSTETPFDEKCSIEINKIEKLEQLKKRIPERTALLNKQPLKQKIVIRGHINILVDAFYQMLHEKKANGLPYLDVSTPDLIHFITSNFADKDGHPLSESTVRTILTPNRPEKRPKNDNKIQL